MTSSLAGTLFLWTLVLWALGWLALPVSRRIFANLPDGGLAAGRIAFVVLVALMVFWGAAARIVPLTLAPVIAAVAALICASGWRDAQTRDWARHNLKSLLFSDAILLASWALFLWVRLAHPELDDLEKPMDIALMSAAWKAEFLPFAHPWFGGAAFTNYYYFGPLMGALMGRALGAPPHVAYNLVQPAFCAFFLSSLWALGAALTRSKWWGVALMFLVGLSGPLEPLRQWNARGWNWPFDWWTTSRVIPDTINEYPAFTMAIGDAHAHFYALSFAALWLSLAWSLLASQNATQQAPASDERAPTANPEARDAQIAKPSKRRENSANAKLRQAPARALERAATSAFKPVSRRVIVVIAGLILGAWLMTNTWDAPVFALFFAAALYLSRANKQGDGAIKLPAGPSKLPDGASDQGDGAIMLPDGAITLPDGAITLPDGAITLPDGAITLPDGASDRGAGSNRLPAGPSDGGVGPNRLPDGPSDRGAGPNRLPAGPSDGGVGRDFGANLAILSVIAVVAAALFFWRFKSPVGGAQFEAWVPDPFSFALLWGGWIVLGALALLLPAATNDAAARFRRLLLGVGLLALVAPFLFYLKGAFGDGDYRHQDTVFKFGLQAWMLLGIGISAELGARVVRLNAVPRLLVASVLLLGAPVLFLASASTVWTRAISMGTGELSLDGTRFLPVAERRAIAWLQTNGRAGEIVMETVPLGDNGLPSGDYYVGGNWGRVGALSGLSSTLGWPQHVWGWDGNYDEVMARGQRVAALYRLPSALETALGASDLGARYTFFGRAEGEWSAPTADAARAAGFARHEFAGNDGSRALILERIGR